MNIALELAAHVKEACALGGAQPLLAGDALEIDPMRSGSSEHNARATPDEYELILKLFLPCPVCLSGGPGHAPDSPERGRVGERVAMD
jgi:hypothetical protein